jgi:phosphoribosylaminoimidazole-succinocarboxamide synthase
MKLDYPASHRLTYAYHRWTDERPGNARVAGVTSVKDFRVESEATADALGRGAFVFTDAYSVFDWGKMPDPIPDKGASLCAMGAFNFELLEDAGVPTHYRGVVDDGDVVPLAEASRPPWEMAIDLTQVPDLPHEGRTYDYDAYHAAAGENYLVPLEIVFRNEVPVGSSLRDRTAPSDHGIDVDGDEWPDETVDLANPIVEFSTKYEESDRYLDRAEADRIAGAADVDALEAVAREVNDIVTEQAASQGLTHEDGKIECLYYQGEIRVADVVGTFDENRFSYEGTQLSKEVIRQYHKRTQPEWVDAVADAKATAKDRDVADWRTLCDVDPDPLADDVVAIVRDMYTAGTNTYTDRDLFDAPPLDSAIGKVKRL